VAPPLQEGDYTLQEALVVGGMLIELLNHADRVRVACLAQLVNMMAPIRTEAGGPAWRQSIFYPLQQASRYGRGEALRPVLQTPHHDCPFGDGIPTLSAAATHDPASGGVVLFALHRDLDAPLELAADLRAFPALRLAEHLVLTGDDLQARNTRQAPDCVLPQRREGAALEGGRLQVRLPAPSWNVLRLVPAEG
jgi:alpha-N-arabinofuranosidase